jgi:hypothetical protein
MSRIRYIVLSVVMAVTMLASVVLSTQAQESEPWTLYEDFTYSPDIFEETSYFTWRDGVSNLPLPYLDGGYMSTSKDPPETPGLQINNAPIWKLHPDYESGDDFLKDNTYLNDISFDLYWDDIDSSWYPPHGQHILIRVYYDDPANGDSIDYTQEYTKSIPDSPTNEGFLLTADFVSNSDLPLYDGTESIEIYIIGAGIGRTHFQIDNLSISGSFYSPPEPPEPPDSLLGGYCVFTTTVTTTGGISGTTPITTTVNYTRSGNLLANSSFESGGASPADWDFLNAPNTQYWLSSGARTGGRALWNTDDYQMTQRLRDYQGFYRMGFYASCPSAASGGDCSGESVAIQKSGSTVASTSGYVLSSTHQSISGTYASAGIGTWVYLDFDPPSGQYGGNIAIDDAFVWPTDADGNQICDPDAYAPPTDEELQPPPNPDPLPNPGGDDIPLPDGDPRSVVCYECTRPANVIQVGHWIGYLGCLIKNLFTCSLKIWVYNVTNSVLGIWRNTRLFFVWLGDGINLILAWGGGAIESGWVYASGIVSNLWAGMRNIPRSVIEYVYQSDLVQWIWQRFDFLRALYPLAIGFVEALIQIFIDLGEAVIHLIDFLRETFTAIRDAFTAEYYEIVVVTDDGEVIDTILPDQMFADGANLTKVLWLVLSAVSVLDQIVGMYQFEFALIVPVGGLALVTLFWTLRTWEKIIPN